MRFAIGIDLRGTNIKAAVVEGQSGQIVRQLSRPTLDGEFVNDQPRFACTVLQLVEELEREMAVGRLQVGLSAPGLANRHGHCIDWMPGRMRGLERWDWSTFLNREVRVLNDAQAALLGEVWLGAARHCQDVIMITLGTGVGGAVFSGGQLLKGAIGRAGHVGHLTVRADAPKDAFNTPGSLEAMLGNKTLFERSSGRFSNTHVLVAAVGAGDAEAHRLWDDSMRALAIAMASLINVLDPELIVLGGGIAAGAGTLLLQPLHRHLDEYEWRPGGQQVRLALATAGEWAGAIGSVYSFFHPAPFQSNPTP